MWEKERRERMMIEKERKEKIREDNFYVYFQCLDLLNYMDNIRPETALKECNQFKSFMLNKNKEKKKKKDKEKKKK